MVLYQVYRRYQYTRHYSTVCSRATLFQFIVVVLIVLAPFFIAYATNDFWQRTSTYIEQPKVIFLNRWIVQVTTEDNPIPKSWSTYHGLNRLLTEDAIAVPIVKFREEDYSFDQVNDKLFLSIEYNNQNLNITAVDLILFFELKFSLMATVIVQCAVQISSSWSAPSSSGLWVSGDLVLYQRNPLPPSGRVTTYNTTFFNDSSISTTDYELTNILREIQSRNVSIVLGNPHSFWRSGATSSFNMEVELTYPKQTVTYTPGFWQVMKFAWVQYLALLVIFYYVLGWVQTFVFENQIILTVREKHAKLS